MSIKLLSLFSGVGGAEEALAQSGKEVSVIAISEIHRYAIATYRSLHGFLPPNIGDITMLKDSDWSSLGDADIVTGGFPCQPFSGMGLRRGFSDSRFKPALSMFDGIKIMMPKYVLMENVKDILNKRHIYRFQKYLDLYRSIGYRVSVHLGNPVDMGYLQSRGRAYIALSRRDVAFWMLSSVNKLSFQKQNFELDSNADPKKNCHWIRRKPFTPPWGEAKFFQCISRAAVDARDRRCTWIPHNGGLRSYTPDEFLQLFGWVRRPEIIFRPKALSRTAFSMSMGNSWHIGHAQRIFDTLPPL